MILLLLTLAACKPDGATAEATAAVAVGLQTAVAETTDFLPSQEITGTLAPVASVQLGFDVPGRMTKLFVQRGQTVRKGQPIAQLDDRMARAQLAQARAAVASADANLEAGETNFARLQQLQAAGGLSAQQFTEAEGGIKAGRAGIGQAKAAVELASTYVENHTLRAPIDGVVSNGPDNAGTMVGAGTPLFLIEDLTSLVVKGAAPETATWLKEGLPAAVLSGIPGDKTEYPATVARVLPALDPATRRIPVEVSVPATPGLRAWGYARVRITADTPVVAVKVPRAALVARPDFCVYTKTGETIMRVPVEVLQDGDPVLLRGDLAGGAMVVLNPPNGLGE